MDELPKDDEPQDRTHEGGEKQHAPPISTFDEREISGGAVRVSDAEPVRVGDPLDTHRANLAIYLVGLLAGLIAFQFVALLVLQWNGDKRTEPLEKAFNVTLPVVAGLVSSAVTFFFSKKS